MRSSRSTWVDAEHNTIGGNMRLARILLSAVLSGYGPVALAQSSADYPHRAIRIIVPLAAGGNVDIVARTLADQVSKSLGQAVLVENRPGASSLVGTQFVARSPADGYTVLAVANTFATVPLIVANPGYDPLKDFTGITLTCLVPQVLVANPALPARGSGALEPRGRRGGARPGSVQAFHRARRRAQGERLARGVHRAHQGGVREEGPARARGRHQARVAQVIERKQLGIAVVGAGRIGSLRAGLAAGHPAVNFIAISDADAARAHDLAQRIGAQFASGDNLAAISRPEVNAVIVATSEGEHVQPVMQALELGKAVLVEKPLALALSEADGILTAAEKRAANLRVGYSRRYKERYLI